MKGSAAKRVLPTVTVQEIEDMIGTGEIYGDTEGQSGHQLHSRQGERGCHRGRKRAECAEPSAWRSADAHRADVIRYGLIFKLEL